MKHYCIPLREGVCKVNLPSPPTDPKENCMMSGLAAEEKEKKNVHLKQLKEIIPVLLVMTHFLHGERGKEMMIVFRGISKNKIPDL